MHSRNIKRQGTRVLLLVRFDLSEKVLVVFFVYFSSVPSLSSHNPVAHTLQVDR
jgi:hypothetical protein